MSNTTLTVINAVLIILVFILYMSVKNMNAKMRRQKKRIDRLLRGSGELSAEEILSNYSEAFSSLEKQILNQSDNLTSKVQKAMTANEKMILSHQNHADQQFKELIGEVNSVRGRSVTSIQKIGLYRYSAFEEALNNFSFSLALLDSLNNGVIITSIYASQGSYTYAKAIRNGKSETVLSSDELKALERALGHSN